VREYVERVLNLHGLYSSQAKVLAMETHENAAGGASTAPN
jgi:hypothetical protein